MSFELKDYAKDIDLNLSNILSDNSTSDLNIKQIYAISLASAYATKNHIIVDYIIEQAADILGENEIQAAKESATIMAMNNIYYRFVHLSSDKEYAKMPARLRMNILAKPSVDKTDFELYSLAVSAINGCGMCIDAHRNQLEKHDISKNAIQDTIRIAAVINAVATALFIG
jgi:alkyl hydroperoxide reductase subunit D